MSSVTPTELQKGDTYMFRFQRQKRRKISYELKAAFEMYRTVVTIYTAQWSHYVAQNGHYMYGKVINIYI
jgi:hypothetical protein